MMNCLICTKHDTCKYKDEYSYAKSETDLIRKNIKRLTPIRVRAICKDFEMDDKEKVEAFISEYESIWTDIKIKHSKL